MRTIGQQHTAPRSIEAARRRADHAPEARMACPVCATSLKGTNFSRHLREKHPNVGTEPPTGPREDLRLVGIDHRIRRTFAVLVAVWLAVLGAAVYNADGPITPDGDPSLAQIARAPFVIVVAVGLLITIVLALLRWATAFRAHVTVTADGISLRHRLGTGKRKVPWPATVETGSLFSVHPDPSDSADTINTVKRHAGSYLRLAHGRRSITVGSPHGTGIRKHWAGWTPGKRRKWWGRGSQCPRTRRVAVRVGRGRVTQTALAEHRHLKYPRWTVFEQRTDHFPSREPPPSDQHPAIRR